MKRFIAVLLAFSVLFVIGGCGKKSTNVNNENNKEESVVSSFDTSALDEASSKAEESSSTTESSVTSSAQEVSSKNEASSKQSVSSTVTSSKAQQASSSAATTSSTPTKTPTVAKTVMPTSASPVGCTEMEAMIFNKVNEERQNGGVAPLTWSSELYVQAKVRAKETHQLASHTRPNGTRFHTAFMDIVNKYVCTQKPKYALGENLCLVKDIQEYTMDEITDAIVAYWINSKAHYDNFMNRGYDSETGLPGLYTTSALAVYSPDNGKSYFVEQVFGDFLIS